mgnify:CR=1 FL=1
MKKLLLLLFSLILPLNSYGESYICATSCIRANEVCQISYTRDSKGFIEGDMEYMIDFGEDAGIVETLYPYVLENEDFLTFTNNAVAPIVERGSNPTGLVSVDSVLINKKTLKFTHISSRLGPKKDSPPWHENRSGGCILIQ